MGNTPSFSRGTPEGELLFDLTNSGTITAEQNATLLQSNGSVYDVAREMKDSVDKIRQTPNLVENNETANHQNHPKSAGLQTWLAMSEKNREWYEKNVGTSFDLVDGGIMMLGDIFELEDETATSNNTDIWNYEGNTLFDYNAAKRHAKQNRKRMVQDWGKYLNFLPGNDKNKSEFLQKVLGLTFNGYCTIGTGGTIVFAEVAGFYWSENSNSSFIDPDLANFLELSKDGVDIQYNGKLAGQSIRCLKN